MAATANLLEAQQGWRADFLPLPGATDPTSAMAKQLDLWTR
jgi:hypothetical protein